MKILKRMVLIILVLAAVGFLFRGWIYRHLVTYKSIGKRPGYLASDTKLLAYINERAGDINNPNIKNIIKTSLSATSRQLIFSASGTDNDPNKLIESKNAHCVGYAAFFSTTCNYLLMKYKLSDTWVAKPQAGQIYLLDINVHRLFSSPFFKDHDFVTIVNNSTGETYAVDPTINDYFFIDFVTLRK
jgi:hypothetical protein